MESSKNMSSKDVEQLKSDVSYIKDAITGSGMFKGNGILDNQQKQLERIKSLEKFRWMLGGGLIFLGTIIFIIWDALKNTQ